MTHRFLKVCGMTRLEDAELAADLGADAVGFVFWPKSPRMVTVETAVRMAEVLEGRVLRVGVFVGASLGHVTDYVQRVGLDAIQLHGDEAVDDFKTVPGRIIRAVSLADERDVVAAANLPPDVTPLVDRYDRNRRGGTGQKANWDLAGALAAKRPIWLAGGLTDDNVAEAIRKVKPAGVDVSSGVESAPGVKDRARLEAFITAVRAAETEGL
jgi:phosphoribosylanthranilate isomerase